MQIRPSRALAVKADLQRMYAQAIKEVVEFEDRDMTRLKTIRASQLPFCPLQYTLSAAMAGPNTPMNFHMAYFTKVGTTVHEVLQRYHGKSGKFLANWECPKCKKWRKLSMRPMCCGVLSEYHEIKIQHKWVTGHIDGVFQDSQGNMIIVDYKTTSTAMAAVKEVNPGRVYQEQVETYAYALQEQYGIKVAAVALIFVVRDNPTTPLIWTKELTSEDYTIIGKRLQKYYHQHKRAYVASTKSDLIWLWRNRLCQKASEIETIAPNCTFKRGCSDRDPTEAIAWFRSGIKKGHIPIKRLVEGT